MYDLLVELREFYIKDKQFGKVGLCRCNYLLFHNDNDIDKFNELKHYLEFNKPKIKVENCLSSFWDFRCNTEMRLVWLQQHIELNKVKR